MSVINTQNIYKSAHFIDNSHFELVFAKFKQNIDKRLEKVSKSFNNCATDCEKLELLENYFEWSPIPEKYFKSNSKLFEKRLNVNSDNIPGLLKNGEVSESFRNLGNSCYKSKKISESLRCYNLALLFAPKTGNHKSLAFANRSALFLSIGEYELGLKDCVRALVNEVDPNIAEKLSTRKAKLEKLVNGNATGFFQDKSKQGQLFLMELAGKIEKSSSIKGAAAWVKIELDELKGRKLVNGCSSAVAAGTGILVDSGYVHLLDKQTNWDTEHCSNCGIVILGGICDSDDVFSSYCSETCLDNFKQQYKDFDSIFPYFHFTEHIHDCLIICKILVKTGESELEAFLNNPKAMETTIKNYDPSDYKSVHNLIAHYSKIDFTNLTNDCTFFKALFLANLLTEQGIFNVRKTLLANLIYKQLNNLKHNMITLSEWRSPEGSISHPFWKDRARSRLFEIKTESYATGVFTLAALLNHSCDPNCVFVKNCGLDFGIVISMRDIPIGEEFCICYKQPWVRLGFEERQKYLKDGFEFSCDCWACREGLGGWDGAGGGGVRLEIGMGLDVGERFLRQGEILKAFEVFLKGLSGVGLDARDVGFQRWQEFGRTVLVEMAMQQGRVNL